MTQRTKTDWQETPSFSKSGGLGAKLTRTFVLLAVVSIASVGYLSFKTARDSIEATRIAGLKSITDLKVDKIEAFFSQLESDSKLAQDYYIVRTNLPIVAQYAADRTNPRYIAAKKTLDGQLKTWLKVRQEVVDVMLVDTTGKIVYAANIVHSATELGLPLPDPSGNSFREGKKRVYFSSVFNNQAENGNCGMLVSAPIHDFDGVLAGVFVFEIEMDSIYKFIQESVGLGDTGETVIAKQVGEEIIFLNHLRHVNDAPLTRKNHSRGTAAVAMQEALKGNRGSGIMLDYRGEQVIASWRPIPFMGWGLVTKMDTAEAFSAVSQLKRDVLIVATIAICLAILLSSILTRAITTPVINLSNAAERISRGELNVRAEVNSSDEIGRLAIAFNSMTDSLANTQETLTGKVSELQKTELVLRQSESWHEAVLAASIDPMITIDSAGIMLTVSDSAETTFGWKPVELIGENIKMLMPDPYRSEHDKYLENYRRTGKTSLLGAARELQALRKDGSTFTCELLISRVDVPDVDEPLFMGIVSDISARIASEAHRRRLERAIAAADEGIMLANSAGIIQYINQAFSELTGYSPEEIVGCKPGVLSSGLQDKSFYEKMWCTILQGETWTGKVINKRKNGSLYDCKLSISPVRDSRGMIEGFVAVQQDVTQELESNRKIQEHLHKIEELNSVLFLTKRSIENSNDELARSNKELDDFAYIASHDLKEPLRGIHNYSRFLMEDYADTLDAEGNEKLETLTRLAQRMEALIDGLLNYSRIGRVGLSVDQVNLNDIVDGVLESLQFSVKENNTEIRRPCNLPILHADRVRVGEIFHNLITNALKYSDNSERWVEIGIVDDHATMTESNAQVQPPEQVFFVRDNGIGIREKHIDSIFRIFKRLHSRDKYGGGTGAGLTIAKKIVEQHGGKIWVESIFGEGTTFYFTLSGVSNDDNAYNNNIPDDSTGRGQSGGLRNGLEVVQALRDG